jgi:hypothetical protein
MYESARWRLEPFVAQQPPGNAMALLGAEAVHEVCMHNPTVDIEFAHAYGEQASIESGLSILRVWRSTSARTAGPTPTASPEPRL